MGQQPANTHDRRPADPDAHERAERRWHHAAVITSGVDAVARLLDVVLRGR